MDEELIEVIERARRQVKRIREDMLAIADHPTPAIGGVLLRGFEARLMKVSLLLELNDIEEKG